MASFLVTGGAGFIGSNIVGALVRDGHRVRVLDNLSSGKRENLARFIDRIDFRFGDLRQVDDVEAAVAGMDYVLHQAAIASVPLSIRDPLAANDTNVAGTLRLLTAARDAGVRQVVLASSSAVYGNSEILPKVESMSAEPISPYAADKLSCELYARVFTETFSLPVVCLRYFNVYGPQQDPNSHYAAVIPKFLAAMLQGEQPIIFGDGLQSRDFCFVDDVVAANLRAATCVEAGGRALNIAGGVRVTLLELVEHLNRALGATIVPIHSDPRQGDVRHSLADIRLAREVLGHTPAVGLEEGLARTVTWYRENGPNRSH